MKLNQIRNLIAVAERGALQASAEALGVSQNALMRSIREIEKELGAALFKGDKKSMVLTPVGEIFVRRATAAQRELDRASDEINQNLGSVAGLVSIGISPSPHAVILPKVLMPFRRRFKEVRVQIVEGDFAKVEREISEGILDFYVGPIWQHHRIGGLTLDKLYDAGRIVVGRKEHPLARAASLAELAGAQWVAASRLELDTLFEQHGLAKPTIIIEAETALSRLSAVAASDALLILSANWLPLIEQTNMLTRFRLNETLDSPSIYIVARQQFPLTLAAAYLHNLIMQTAIVTRSPAEMIDVNPRPDLDL